jgi:hypothetical protein
MLEYYTTAITLACKSMHMYALKQEGCALAFCFSSLVNIRSFGSELAEKATLNGASVVALASHT